MYPYTVIIIDNIVCVKRNDEKCPFEWKFDETPLVYKFLTEKKLVLTTHQDVFEWDFELLPPVKIHSFKGDIICCSSTSQAVVVVAAEEKPFLITKTRRTLVNTNHPVSTIGFSDDGSLFYAEEGIGANEADEENIRVSIFETCEPRFPKYEFTTRYCFNNACFDGNSIVVSKTYFTYPRVRINLSGQKMLLEENKYFNVFNRIINTYKPEGSIDYFSRVGETNVVKGSSPRETELLYFFANVVLYNTFKTQVDQLVSDRINFVKDSIADLLIEQIHATSGPILEPESPVQDFIQALFSAGTGEFCTPMPTDKIWNLAMIREAWNMMWK